MTGTAIVALTFAAALGSGIVAGVFFAFSTFVMGALGRLPPEQGIAAMQSINVAVINPWFMTAFMGTAALCLVLAILAFLNLQSAGAFYVLAGAGLYVAGTFIVTMAFNVPLNNALAAADPASAQGHALWAQYLSRWTFWNHIRTIAPLAALTSFIFALRA